MTMERAVTHKIVDGRGAHTVEGVGAILRSPAASKVGAVWVGARAGPGGAGRAGPGRVPSGCQWPANPSPGMRRWRARRRVAVAAGAAGHCFAAPPYTFAAPPCAFAIPFRYVPPPADRELARVLGSRRRLE
jgi:hypothetical protein